MPVFSIARHRRVLNLAGFAACAGLLASAYYLEWVQGLEPCPLCVFQRGVFLLLALGFLLGVLAGGRAVAAVLAASAAGGVALAARHLWLQSLPADQVPACGPGLDYMLEAFPLWDALSMVLAGSGECAEVDRVLGLSIPWWTLAAYVALGGAGALVNLARPTGGTGG